MKNAGGPAFPTELVWIGDEFYFGSGTIMSTIYTVDGWRSNWGCVQSSLRAGKEVHIRPATNQEMEHYLQELAMLKTREGE